MTSDLILSYPCVLLIFSFEVCKKQVWIKMTSDLILGSTLVSFFHPFLMFHSTIYLKISFGIDDFPYENPWIVDMQVIPFHDSIAQ